jgi:predicted neuraminidase
MAAWAGQHMALALSLRSPLAANKTVFGIVDGSLLRSGRRYRQGMADTAPRQQGQGCWLRQTERRAVLPERHGLFGNCHASTIAVRPDGERLVAFFAGLREGAGDTAIWLARWQGGAWQAPVRLLAEDGLAHWNPVLHADGDRVLLFYKVGATVHDWTTRVAVLEGGRWSDPRPLVPGDPAPRGPVKNKLIVLADGSWLAPGSVESQTLWDAFTDRSDDGGRSWARADVPLEHRPAAGQDGPVWQGLSRNALWETDLARVFQWDGVIQPSLWESAPGHVHMLLRSTRGAVYRADSRDGGRSWGEAYATDLPNNNSGLDVVRLPDGRLVLAHNPVAGNWGRRTPLSLSVSADGGESWSLLADLESGEGEFSYPAVILAGTALHVTYTSDRTNIIHHCFDVV